MIRQRLDEALVARMLYPSRARSRDAVLRGLVQVDGEPARKPSQMVLSDAKLTITDEGSQYVSRAAVKLVHALDHFQIEVKGRECLDIGASQVASPKCFSNVVPNTSLPSMLVTAK